MPIVIEVGPAGAVRAMGRFEGRDDARRQAGRGARQHGNLAGHAGERRRPRRQPQPPQLSSGTAIKQPATNQAATAQN